MSRILKRALLWLIVLALPVQGTAAATMVLCGPIHERMMGAQSETDHDAHHQHHTHHHESTVNADDQDSKGTHHLPTDKYSCSACAACCASAAISGDAYRVPDSVVVSAGPATADASPFTGFVPEGPEHPPRHILV